ncbi:hypothetical protein CONCODRAFT_14031, partial [Conidiobolus coronatus NRRL 28638]
MNFNNDNKVPFPPAYEESQNNNSQSYNQQPLGDSKSQPQEQSSERGLFGSSNSTNYGAPCGGSYGVYPGNQPQPQGYQNVQQSGGFGNGNYGTGPTGSYPSYSGTNQQGQQNYQQPGPSSGQYGNNYNNNPGLNQSYQNSNNNMQYQQQQNPQFGQ